MKLFKLTHKISGKTKWVVAKTSADAQWIAARSKKRMGEWDWNIFKDPYEAIGAKSYWENHVPSQMRPKWATKLYELGQK